MNMMSLPVPELVLLIATVYGMVAAAGFAMKDLNDED
jgi:hypothetical protein